MVCSDNGQDLFNDPQIKVKLCQVIPDACCPGREYTRQGSRPVACSLSYVQGMSETFNTRRGQPKLSSLLGLTEQVRQPPLPLLVLVVRGKRIL